MPGILDRGTQIANELRTTRKFGKEIRNMKPVDRDALTADFLPELEKVVNLPALQALNEKMRKRIDATPTP